MDTTQYKLAYAILFLGSVPEDLHFLIISPNRQVLISVATSSQIES
jgi:hypothetical protein